MEKPDSTMKSRLFIDLLRSGINGDVVLPERVVLPRIIDFVDSIVDLMEYDIDWPLVGTSGTTSQSSTSRMPSTPSCSRSQTEG
jgi:hypothetical protein